MKAFLSKLTNQALDLLFPIESAGCGRESKILCDSCIPGLAKLAPPYCRVCAAPDTSSPCRWCTESPPSVDGIRAPFLMEGPVRESVYSLKYRGVRAAAPDLARLLAQYMACHEPLGKVIVPVPLHRRRLRDRGYNQSELLARELSKLAAMPQANKLLARVKDTPPQVEAADRSQRWDNVRESFQADAGAAGLKVLLIDDVVTTGATMSSCAAALKAAGAASVWGLTLARAREG